MHHLYALNHELINDEIDEITGEPVETERKSHSLLQINSMFNQIFFMVREANNISGALGIVKQLN